MQLFIDTISLQTPKGRLLFFGGISLALVLSPYRWLAKTHLSLYADLHIPSPSIGLTRAYWQVLHGNFVSAWDRNPLIFIVLVVVAGIITADLRDLVRR